MRVTTELKHLIQEEFERKRQALLDKAATKAETSYQSFVKEVEDSSEWWALQIAAKDFYQKFGPRLKSYSDTKSSYGSPYWYNEFANLKNLTPEHYFGMRGGKVDTSPEIQQQISALQRAEQSLLIKLNYEKDLDNVRTALAEYGIEI